MGARPARVRHCSPIKAEEGNGDSETFPPTSSASGRGRCRAAGRVAFRVGASLSVAADDNGRALLSGRPDRYDCAHHGGADADIARADHHRREYDGRCRHDRRRSGGAGDGYTISIGHWGTHVVNGAIYELQYHVFNDFEPVSLIATNPQIIVARKTVPAKDLKELIAWLKANVATATQGTAGHGSGSHVSG